MSYLKIYTSLFILFFAVACSNTTDDEETTQTLSPQIVDSGVNKIPSNQTVTAPSAGGSTALNPAHGMPGHRCDIAVGAPLNSAPAAATNNQTQQPPIMMQPAPATAPSTGNTGAKNPAHGLPGHRCDIAVGAPLN